jgi:hypothetical protein
MERIIKFRAWDKIKKRWATDYDTIYLSDEGMAFIVYQDGGWAPSETLYRIDVDIVFFTGLLDSKGVEIYEKDLCYRNGHLRIVVFQQGAYRLLPLKSWEDEIDMDHVTEVAHGQWLLSTFQSEIEVIGNVFTHPELIK